MSDSPWLSIDQLAARLQMQPTTLAYWRVQGKGPAFAKFGRHIRYHVDDVVEWESEQRRAS